MRSAYRGIAHAISACVVLQATWIALAWFIVLKDTSDGKAFSEGDENVAHALHSFFGMAVLPLLAVALLVVSVLAKIPGASRWAGFVLLAVVVEIGLAVAAESLPAIGALHGIGAFVVLGVAELSARAVGTGAAPAPGAAEAAAA